MALVISMMQVTYCRSYHALAVGSGNSATAIMPAFARDSENTRHNHSLAHHTHGISLTITHGIDKHLRQSTCY